jgi:release factor glutamine methyltransferase
MKYSDYLKGTDKILQDSKREKGPYSAIVLGKKFVVFPNVFSPKYFKDTEIFAKNLPVEKGEEFLEIGSGTGIISIFVALRGAKRVLAIDINPSAVKNTKENVRIHKLQKIIEVRKGNLYASLKKNEKFDTIFWNTPFGLIDKKIISNLEKSVYDPWYKSTEKFIKQASKYLKNNGRLFIGFSSTLGKLDLIKKFAREFGFKLKLVYKEKSDEFYPVYFEIFEAKKYENYKADKR